MTCVCDVRLTSDNASVALCDQHVNDFCQSSSDSSSATKTTVVINAKPVPSGLRYHLVHCTVTAPSSFCDRFTTAVCSGASMIYLAGILGGRRGGSRRLGWGPGVGPPGKSLGKGLGPSPAN